MAVDARQANGAAAFAVEQVDEVLVDLAGQHHQRHLRRLAVGDAQAVDEAGQQVHPRHRLGQLGTAAVHEHDPYADEREQRHVAHHGLFQIVVDHRVAAVLDDDDLAAVLLDIGQGADEHLCALVVFRHLTSLPFVQVL